MAERRRVAAGILVLGFAAASGLVSSRSAARKPDVHRLELNCIERIVSFVVWPKDAKLARPDQPFVWTFVGSTPLHRKARERYALRRVQGHRVVVRSARSASGVSSCHLMFIASSAAGELARILNAVGSRPVLTIADTPGMAERGVAINLYQEQGKFRFEINRKALERAGIQASFRLLTLARIVEEDQK